MSFGVKSLGVPSIDITTLSRISLASCDALESIDPTEDMREDILGRVRMLGEMMEPTRGFIPGIRSGLPYLSFHPVRVLLAESMSATVPSRIFKLSATKPC